MEMLEMGKKKKMQHSIILPRLCLILKNQERIPVVIHRQLRSLFFDIQLTLEQYEGWGTNPFAAENQYTTSDSPKT